MKYKPSKRLKKAKQALECRFDSDSIRKELLDTDMPSCQVEMYIKQIEGGTKRMYQTIDVRSYNHENI